MENSFMHMLKSPLRFKLFLLKHLPMAFLAGLRIEDINEKQASVSVSLNYLTKNPFGSIYFACLAMAAELSTGILAMNAIEESHHTFSSLVVNLEATFTKKAVGKITFHSSDGEALQQTVEDCIVDKTAQKIIVTSIGKDEAGEEVAKFSIMWSFKAKNLS